MRLAILALCIFFGTRCFSQQDKMPLSNGVYVSVATDVPRESIRRDANNPATLDSSATGRKANHHSGKHPSKKEGDKNREETNTVTDKQRNQKD